MTLSIEQFPVLTHVGWTLIHVTWEVVLLWILYWIVTRTLLQSRSAQTQYFVACGTMLLVGVAILVTFAGLAGNYFGNGPIASWFAAPIQMSAGEPNRVEIPRMSPEGDWVTALIRHVSPLVSVVGVMWLLSIIWQLWRTGRALIGLQQLAIESKVLDPTTVPGWLRLCEQLVPRQAVHLGESEYTTSPFTAGWLKPIVLLPVGLLTSLTPFQIEAILAHELAHIRRRDYLINLLQSMIEQILFFHPCVSLLGRDIRNLREHCCDDLAIAAIGGKRRVYAESLIAVEEFRPSTMLALGMAGGGLLDRVKRLAQLQKQSERQGGFGRLVVSISLLLVLGAFSADAAIQRVQDDDAVRKAKLRSKTESIYDLFDVNRSNPEFLSTLIPALETFRASKGISLEDALRLSAAINLGARPNELFTASQIIFRGEHPLGNPKGTSWHAGNAKRWDELSRALFEHARNMSRGKSQHEMVRAAVILAAQENYGVNNMALESILRDADFDLLSGLSTAKIKRIRHVLAYYSNQTTEWAKAYGRWVRQEQPCLPPAIAIDELERNPHAVWMLAKVARGWEKENPLRKQVVELLKSVPIYGPDRIEWMDIPVDNPPPLY